MTGCRDRDALQTTAISPGEHPPLTRLAGVGPKLRERLARLNIRSVQDLLFHLPLRYQDRTRARPIASLAVGDEALIEGLIQSAEIGQGARRSLRVLIRDESGGYLQVRFFHFSLAQAQRLRVGARLRCFGEVRQGPRWPEMIHPEYELDPTGERGATRSALTPIYPLTEGLSQASMRALAEQALALLAADSGLLEDWLPTELRTALGLMRLDESLRLLHCPPVGVDIEALIERRHPAARRLAFEELLAHQLALRQLRGQRRGLAAPALTGDGELRRRLRATLGFRLTDAQERVLVELEADLRAPVPMMRLLQGDVGSGKTVVAALAALQAVEAGWQAALMAPTELLAEQHWRTVHAWLAPLGAHPAWLSGRHKGAERERILASIAAGEAMVVVGTHALFQDEVRFAALGLAMIDEQHRFGVHQRLRLRAKGDRHGGLPHQLIMTATPIPRSLAMAVYADLDLSIIDELPPGRTPVTTVAVPDSRRQQVIERVREACAQGRQAFWVCTLVEESEALQCRAAEATAARLRESLPELRIGLLHGRVKPAEREPVMRAFAAGELAMLVATTVIEVVVDVPNASLMIIENPERLGLAQLHQLRGRVGRGAVASYCLLLYRPPLSASARARLDILRRETSGFKIADADLRLRGAGEVLGTRQAGAVHLRLADPLRDADLVSVAQRQADRLLREAPALAGPLIQRWLGRRDAYGHV